MKALEILKTINRIKWWHIGEEISNNIDEAIAELEALQQVKSCEGCKYLDKDTLNSEGNAEYTKGFCVLLGLSKNDRPFKYCSEFTPNEQ